LNSASADPYNSLVRQYFVNPEHAGDLANPYSHTLLAVADDASGASLCLAAGVEDERLCELRFRARGCPHMLAAAEHFCREFTGRPVAALQDFRPAATIRELEIPVGKTGRILLLEDAIRRLWRNFGDRT
jgi:NifU-like protein involved in Fe-S cluster formation